MEERAALPTPPAAEGARPPLISGLVIPSAAWLAIFFFGPALLMVGATFLSSSFAGIEWTPTLANYRRLLGSEVAPRLLGKSLRMGFTVTVIVLGLAYPFAYWLARRRPHARNALLLLIIVPYWISYVIRTFAWYPLLGTHGVLNTLLIGLGVVAQPVSFLLFSEFSVHVGLVYVYFPFAAIPIYLALDRIDGSLLEASADLGATPLQTFWRVTFPLTLSGTLGGGVMVFILAVGAYVTPKLLGGPSGIMFGEIIADQFGGTFNWSFGATLALTLVTVMGLALFLVGRRVRLREIFLGEAR